MVSDVGDFFAVARERQWIHIRRSMGKEFPWTEDPVLRDYRFCHVYREQDKVTKWFRNNIRDPLRREPDVLMATVWFRWFNLPSVGQYYDLGRTYQEQAQALRGALMRHREHGNQIITGAYMVKSPAGYDKVNGLMDCIDRIAEDAWEGTQHTRSLEDLHTWLIQYPYMGRFMAYEVVSDLRHTAMLERAPDIDTWASFGPGAARGLQWVYGGPKRNYSSRSGQQQMLEEAGCLLAESREEWPSEWPAWEMREVEHWLCEYDKYCRAKHNGQTLKRRYTP